MYFRITTKLGARVHPRCTKISKIRLIFYYVLRIFYRCARLRHF
eukprot:UN10742